MRFSATATIPRTGSAEALTSADALLLMLQRLDGLLGIAIHKAEATFGSKAFADPYRGLLVRLEDAENLLGRVPLSPVLFADEVQPSSTGTRLDGLAHAFGLSSFDLDVLMVAVAPDLDLRYERLYGFLQDDVTRRRATIDLTLELLCPSAAVKLARRANFAADAALIRSGLIHLLSDAQQPGRPLLAQSLQCDPQVVRLILGETGLDARLAAFSELNRPVCTRDGIGVPSDVHAVLAATAAAVRENNETLRLAFTGPVGSGRREAVEALASFADLRLLTVRLDRAEASGYEPAEAAGRAIREGWFLDAIVYLDGYDGLTADGRRRVRQVLTQSPELVGGAVVVALKHDAEGVPAGFLPVELRPPDVAERRSIWEAYLGHQGVEFRVGVPEALAGRFRLSSEQIGAAVTAACLRSRWNGDTDGPSADDLFAAARGQSSSGLSAMAVKILPAQTWDDLVLPADSLEQLREIGRRVEHGPRVFGDWGFGRRLSLGRGATALFAGPSGTGKTMAAEVLAHGLGLDLYRIDLAAIVSKYIGETEKNLDRLFDAAESSNAVLFFDEAEALFGKRSEVRDAHDRYANIEVAYLLQKMEQYDGLAILATNLRGNLDEAFTRRLAFAVHFPFPDVEARRRIWEGVWPAELPLADDLDFDLLATRFKLSGGNIRNAALAAAFLAADDDSPVGLSHVLKAVRREYQKMGKQLSAAELSPLEMGVGR